MKQPDRKSAEFDQLLDKALQSYTPAAPRPGLEDRTLAAISIESRQPQSSRRYRLRGNIPLLAAAAAMFALAIALSLAWHFPTHANTIVQTKQSSEPPAVSQLNLASVSDPATNSEPRPKRSQGAAHRGGAQVPPSQTKPTLFGPPRATAEELLVARAAMEHPDFVASLSTSPRDWLSAPISIAPISSRPIGPRPIVVAAIEITPDSIKMGNHER